MANFRLHVVALPHTHTTRAFTACAFTERVRKFCDMMHGLGHHVVLYAGERNDARCAEHVPCVTERERQDAVGDRHFVEASFDAALPHWRAFNARATEAVRARAESRDFLCLIGGTSHKPIADALPELMTVEFSIGYGGNFAPFRIWESYAWMHLCYGSQGGSNPNAIDGRWFDAVIPGSFDPSEFSFRADKDDYYVFLGRLTPRKGVGVAADACRRAGVRLVIAGQGEPPEYGEYVGVVGPEERGRLLAGARAVFCCASYVEPFGNAAVEAQLCGTPVLCSPFGAMVETVVDGVSGFHCHTLSEFVEGIERAGDLDAVAIRDRAVRLYSPEVVAAKYQRHFDRLSTTWGGGWYA